MNKNFVLLISPRTTEADAGSLELPMGLLYMAGVLIKNNFEVKIINQQTDTNWLRKLLPYLEKKPICIGLSCTTGKQIKYAIELSKKIKEISDIPIIWGGYHPTFMPDQTLEEDFVDIVVRGEGEISFLNLVISLRDDKPLNDVKGISFKTNGKAIHNPDEELVDLDALPRLPYELLEIDKLPHHLKKRAPLLTSRGCPHRCSFCAATLFNRHKWRGESPEKIIENIRNLFSTNKDVERIHIDDDNFFVDIGRVRKFISLIKEEKLDFKWGVLSTINSFKRIEPEFISEMYGAGLRAVFFGAESGSEKILKLIKKNYTPQDIIDVNKKMVGFDITPEYSFMAGFPIDDDEEETKKTIRLIKRIKQDNPKAVIWKITNYTPYPGTEMFDLALKKGYKPPKNLEGWINVDFYKKSYGDLADYSKSADY